MKPPTVTEAILANRAKWKYRGQQRPEFAVDPREGQESVWDYPRPPAMVPDARHVVVTAPTEDESVVILADTVKSVKICETAGPPVFYIPPSDVNFEFLKELPGSSMCEWKGQARYWALNWKKKKKNDDDDDDDDDEELVAWDYPVPFPEYNSIAGYVSFYPGKLNCTIHGERVLPQPGPGFYGGWVTTEVVGPFKGEPGTEAW